MPPRFTCAACSSGKLTTPVAARLRPVPQPLQGDPERIEVWVQVITGMELDAGGAVRVLDAEEWHPRKQRLEELGGPPR